MIKSQSNKNIVGKTIEKMKTSFGCESSNILAAIGVGIQAHNYQIDTATAQYFESKYLQEDGPGQFRLDVQANIVDQLLDHNIPQNQIEIDNRCSFDNPELFYSYRRDGKHSGRMMGIIGLYK